MLRRHRLHFPWRLAFVALLGGAVWAVLAWPRINQVSTGSTPEYPDLKSAEYTVPGERVFAAAQAAAASLKNWSVVGAGHGPRGWSLQAVHTTRPLGIREEISVTITERRGTSTVVVLSRSSWAKWDFGQNARNIRSFLRRLDEELLR
jgi:hypothetical protein